MTYRRADHSNGDDSMTMSARERQAKRRAELKQLGLTAKHRGSLQALRVLNVTPAVVTPSVTPAVVTPSVTPAVVTPSVTPAVVTPSVTPAVASPRPDAGPWEAEAISPRTYYRRRQKRAPR
jgi:hypothetical protein